MPEIQKPTNVKTISSADKIIRTVKTQTTTKDGRSLKHKTIKRPQKLALLA